MLNEQNTMNHLIKAVNLTKHYGSGSIGLAGIDISIAKGEMVGLLGTSGSGKTTFFRLLNGSITSTSGELFVFGESLKHISHKSLRRLRSRMALIHQHHNVIPGLSVAQNILMGRLGQLSLPEAVRLAFFPTKKDLLEVHRILKELDLGDKILDRATDLSGGQQQRVAIARALLSEAEIILADEPIASVDSKTAEIILNLFKKLNTEKGVTVIMNLHQKDFALNFCQRIIVLDRGHLVYDGTPENWISEGRKMIVSPIKN